MEKQLEVVKNAIQKVLQDKNKLLIHVVKSNNNNSVLYFYENNEIKARWLLVEEEIPTLKDLDMAENLLFGASIETIENDTLIFTINGDTDKRLRVELVLDSAGNPALITAINNQPARVIWAYAYLSKGVIPVIERLIVGGTNFQGKPVTQEMV